MTKKTGRPRGRPAFKVTDELRRKVAAAAGGGMAHDEIALGLGISRNTLEKHFEKELEVGAYSKRVEVLDSLFRTAKKGNVAAARLYLANAPRSAVAPPADPAKPSAPEGKKAQANEAAKTAQEGTEWQDILQPQPENLLQ